MRRLVRSEGGFTLVELVVVLAVIALLAAVLTPLVTRYIQDARIARAATEVKVIGAAIQKLEQNLGRYPFYASGAGVLRETDANAKVAVLYGPGTEADTADTKWTLTDAADSDCTNATCVRDTLENILITNTVAYPASASAGLPLFWKGPYVEKIESDPWGNRYYVNIINAKSNSADAAFVLSAGPNGKIDTSFNLDRKTNIAPSNDDILYRIR